MSQYIVLQRIGENAIAVHEFASDAEFIEQQYYNGSFRSVWFKQDKNGLHYIDWEPGERLVIELRAKT